MTQSNKLRRACAALCVAGAAMSAGGCDDPDFEQYRGRRDSITSQHGDSVRQNIAVQTIDPWPKHARDTSIGLDGHRALLAAERYRANKVIPPRGLATQSVSTGNGAGQGGNGGNGSGGGPSGGAEQK